VVAELHDLLGHHLSLIHLQADVALAALDHDPARARASLVAIRDASGRVLHEIRAALGVLDGFTAGSPVALADLGALVAAARAAGQPVALRVLGRERPVPQVVGHAVYRVVQESLTNARQHSGAATPVAVTLVYGSRHLVVQVDDDGALAAAPARFGGRGLGAMRDRVVRLGGALDVGPCRTGGFRVRARMPLRTPASPLEEWRSRDGNRGAERDRAPLGGGCLAGPARGG
jgi:signal transduction histidine kinase